MASLKKIHISSNQLTYLPESIGKLTNLKELYLTYNQLTKLPESIGKLSSLTKLGISGNRITTLPESIGQLNNLSTLHMVGGKLQSLPNSIGGLINLTIFYFPQNSVSSLPISMSKLINLASLWLDDNPITDLSVLKSLPCLGNVRFCHVDLTYRYYTKLNEWKSEWLLDEDNTEIRRVLIQQLGYNRICQELDAITIDTWQEYVLLKIEEVDIEPMMLLKMTCPSTDHIHILRVPPEMVTAEAAITWVNHGIHPDDIAVQT
jgi:leucine-rich repeat protein SHOC2